MRGGVEQACAVEVHGEAGIRRHRPDPGHHLERHDGAAGGIVRVLQADQLRRREGRIGGGLDGGRHVGRIELSAAPVHRARDGAGHRREAAAFGIVDVGGRLDDDLAAVDVVGDECREVGHCARRHEQRVFLAGQLARQAFELQHGRVVPAGGVAEARHCDGRHHLGRRQGDGIAAEVVEVHLPLAGDQVAAILGRVLSSRKAIDSRS